MRMKKPKIIVIGGPTSSGKTDLSITLAKAVGGEVVSSDSRQVYRGLSIGTGKVKKREMRGIPHHLLDVADPKKQYSASDFANAARAAIADIARRGYVPIVVGGTGFYIDTLLGSVSLPDVPPDAALRKKIGGKSLAWLQSRLKKIDPKRFRTVDKKNKVRLIRSIEIAEALGAMPSPKSATAYEALYFGVHVPMTDLKKKIRTRLITRMQEGMLREVRNLRSKGLSWKRMHELGLEYRYCALHLRGKLSKEDLIEILDKEIFRYAKHQMTWFKRNKNILWISPKDTARVIRESKRFLGLPKFGV